MPTRETLGLLGITSADLEGCRQAPNLKVATERLERLQDLARRSYHKLALDLHPDRTGGDQEKTAKFREIAEAYEVITDLRIMQHMPPPQPMMVRISVMPTGVRFTGGSWASTGSATNNSPTGTWSWSTSWSSA